MTDDTGVVRNSDPSSPRGIAITVLLSIALYNVGELSLIIWGYFKRHSGLYFWSFNVSTYGVLLYSLGFLLKFRTGAGGLYAYLTLLDIGWVSMITGQSVVLWSRLHLIMQDRLKLRLILYMVIFNTIMMCIPTIVMTFGANSFKTQPWLLGYRICENIQVTAFFIQEVTISSFYIYETLHLARLQSEAHILQRSRFLMFRLIAINIVIILLDIVVLGLEYARLYDLQIAYKGFLYSVKLKMEFNVLTQLKDMTTGNKESSSHKQSMSDAQRHFSVTVATVEGDRYAHLSPTTPSPVSMRGSIPESLSEHSVPQSSSRHSEDSSNSDSEVLMATEAIVRKGYMSDVPGQAFQREKIQDTKDSPEVECQNFD